jgi:2,4-dienoyl-CoA reductase-like NADH-dependent reductase (Old Yellow Enzyme family)
VEDSIAFATALKALSINVVDCSSGGLGGAVGDLSKSKAEACVARGYGFQVPFAERIRGETGIATMAVGLLVDPRQAEG